MFNRSTSYAKYTCGSMHEQIICIFLKLRKNDMQSDLYIFQNNLRHFAIYF